MKRKETIYCYPVTCRSLDFLQGRESYVRPDLHLPDSLERAQDSISFGDQDWRDIYTDATLRSLIERALDHNKDMLIAAARVKEMAAQKRISTAALLPDIKGKVTAERELEIMEEMLSRDQRPLKHNFSFHGNSIFGEICAGHVRPVLPNICNLSRRNAHCG